MWTLHCFLLVFFSNSTPEPQMDRLYLQRALALRDRAHQMQDMSALRDYTVLLTEYYVKQITFRSFFMKDYLTGDKLYSMRRQEMPLVASSDAVSLVEENLEVLLANAAKRFPEDPDLEFALAQFCFRGRGLYGKGLISCEPNKILDTFMKAMQRGVVSPASLYALCLDSEARKEAGKPEVWGAWAEKAYQLNPHDPQILYLFIENLLERGESKRAWLLAKKLFELSPELETKMDAVLACARSYYQGKHVEDALKVVDYGLQAVPDHVLLWMIGLDLYRERKDCEGYRKHALRFLELRRDHPSLFSSYVDYLSTKGIHSCDEIVIKEYAEIKLPDPTQGFIQASNYAKYLMLVKRNQECLEWLARAEDAFKQIANPNEDMRLYWHILSGQLKELAKEPKE